MTTVQELKVEDAQLADALQLISTRHSTLNTSTTELQHEQINTAKSINELTVTTDFLQSQVIT
jgi:hypothetical protein